MSVEERVAHMEQNMAVMQRGLRRYRLALLAVVLALVGMALVGATGDKNAVFDTVTAQQFSVVNKTGTMVGALGVEKEMGALYIYNDSAVPTVGLMTTDRGEGQITVWNGAGKTSVTMLATGYGGAVFTYNGNEQWTAGMGMDEEGNGKIELQNNQTGKVNTIKAPQ